MHLGCGARCEKLCEEIDECDSIDMHISKPQCYLNLKAADGSASNSRNHASLRHLKAGEAVYQAGKLFKTLARIHY